MMNLKKLGQKLFGIGEKPKQTFFLYCPECNNELCSSNSFVSDTDDGVKYKCSQCGHESMWNFDLIPGAVEIKNGIPTPKEMRMTKCPTCGTIHER